MSNINYLDYDGLTVYTDRMMGYVNNGDSLSSEITVHIEDDGNVGTYKNGDVIPAGTSLETILRKILIQQIPPTYTAPIINSTVIPVTTAIVQAETFTTTNYEVIITWPYGQAPRFKINSTFINNDAGDLTAFSKDSSNLIMGLDTLSSNISNKTATWTGIALPNTIANANLNFSLSCSYKEGAIKNDNLGNVYSTGHIMAGTISQKFSINRIWPGYIWGICSKSTTDLPITANFYTSSQSANGYWHYISNYEYTSKDTFSMKAALDDGSTAKYMLVACPANEAGVEKIIMPSASNADCTADFVKMSSSITVSVLAGSDNYVNKEYNVWVYEPALITEDQTFEVTLG